VDLASAIEVIEIVWLALAPTWKVWLLKVPSSRVMPLNDVWLGDAVISAVSWAASSVERGAVGGAVGAVGGLDRQFAQALQVVADFAQARLRRSAPARCRRWHCAPPG
jgi:hypothetical protein